MDVDEIGNIQGTGKDDEEDKRCISLEDENKLTADEIRKINNSWRNEQKKLNEECEKQRQRNKEILYQKLDQRWKHRYSDIENYIDKNIKEYCCKYHGATRFTLNIKDLNFNLELKGRFLYIFVRDLDADEREFLIDHITSIYRKKGFQITRSCCNYYGIELIFKW